MLAFLHAVIIPLACCTNQAGASPAPVGDLQRLKGHWKPVDVEIAKKPLSPELIAKQDLINHLRMNFEENEMIIVFGDQVQRNSFQLHPEFLPKAIDVIRPTMRPPRLLDETSNAPSPAENPATETLRGVYEWKEDTLKLCLPVNAKDARPKSFEEALRSGHSVMVLVREGQEKASSRLNDKRLIGELRKLGIDAFSSSDRSDTGSVYVRMTGKNTDQLLKAGASSMHKLSSIAGLHLHDSDVTDFGLAHLRVLNSFGHINLSNTNISDAGLTYLSHMTRLHYLILNGTRVTQAGIAKLQKALPSLRIEKLSTSQYGAEKAIQSAGGILFSDGSNVNAIEFTNQSGFSDAGLKRLEGHMEAWKGTLTRLSLANTAISDAGLPCLYELDKLRHLDLTGTRVTSAGVAELKRRLPVLEVKLSRE